MRSLKGFLKSKNFNRVQKPVCKVNYAKSRWSQLKNDLSMILVLISNDNQLPYPTYISIHVWLHHFFFKWFFIYFLFLLETNVRLSKRRPQNPIKSNNKML